MLRTARQELLAVFYPRLSGKMPISLRIPQIAQQIATLTNENGKRSIFLPRTFLV